MQEVKEAFGSYLPVGVNAGGTLIAAGDGGASLGGFLCSTTGTLVLTDGAGASILASTPVTAGVCLPIPIKCPKGCVYALGGGASGMFMYS